MNVDLTRSARLKMLRSDSCIGQLVLKLMGLGRVVSLWVGWTGSGCRCSLVICLVLPGVAFLFIQVVEDF